MKNKLYVFVFALFLIGLTSASLIGTVSAADLRLVLTTPSVTFNNNISDIASYYVGVQNKNEFPISINILAPTDLLISFDGNTSFELQPNETRDVPFSIKINTTGVYSKDIQVTFSGNGTSLSLSEKILFNIEEDTEAPVITTKSGGGSSSTKKSVLNANGTEVNETEVNVTDFLEVNESQEIGNVGIDNEETPKSPGLLGFGIAILIFVVIIALAVYFMRKGKKDVTEETKESGGKTKDEEED